MCAAWHGHRRTLDLNAAFLARNTPICVAKRASTSASLQALAFLEGLADLVNSSNARYGRRFAVCLRLWVAWAAG